MKREILICYRKRSNDGYESIDVKVPFNRSSRRKLYIWKKFGKKNLGLKTPRGDTSLSAQPQQKPEEKPKKEKKKK